MAPILLLCKSVLIREHSSEVAIPRQFISKSNRVVVVAYSYETRRFPFKVDMKVSHSMCLGAMSHCTANNNLQKREMALPDLDTRTDDIPLEDPGLEESCTECSREYLKSDCDLKTGTLIITNPYSLCLQSFHSKIVEFHGASCVAFLSPFTPHIHTTERHLCNMSISLQYSTLKRIKLSV